MRWNVLRLNPRPFLHVERRPFSSRDCRTKSMFSLVLTVLIRPLRPLLRLRHVPSLKNLSNVVFIACLLGAGTLHCKLKRAKTTPNSVSALLGPKLFWPYAKAILALESWIGTHAAILGMEESQIGPTFCRNGPIIFQLSPINCQYGPTDQNDSHVRVCSGPT